MSCCAAKPDEDFELKYPEGSQTPNKDSSKRPNRQSILSNSHVEAGASSSFTKNSSSAQADSYFEQKKLLQFRMFKSLKSTTEISSKYKVGRELGSGAFGKVHECLNTQTGVTCAIKIVNKKKISKHPVLIQLMEQELEVL